MPLAMPRRPVAFALLIALNVALVVVGYSVFWWVTSDNLETEVVGWTERQRARGFDASYGNLEVGGFPLRLRASLSAPRLGRVEASGTWRWWGDGLTLVLRPWQLERPIIRLDGAQHVSVSHGATANELTMNAAAAGAELFFDLGRIERIAGSAREVRLDGTPLDGTITIERLRFNGLRDWRQDGPPAIDLSVLVEDIGLPQPPEGLAADIARIRVELSLVGSVPDDSALIPALAAWRDGGGTIEVRTFALAWGELEINAEGTFALDAAMRPVGAGTATIGGHERTIDGLIADGRLNARDGATAKVVLNLLARLSPGEGGRANVPISIQEGRIFLGPIAIARIEPLVAPGF